MNVLVTGASGYLGGKLCEALVGKGYSVRALVRRSSELIRIPAEVQIVYGDVTDLASLLEASAGCEALIHSAAVVESWIPDPSRFSSVNVGGLENVLQAYRETKTLKKIVYTSSFFALGPTNGAEADEEQVHPEKSFCNDYEKSKVRADKIAHQAAREGIPIVILCPGLIYGPGKITAGNVVARMTSFTPPKHPFWGDFGTFDYPYLTDMSPSFLKLIERFNGRLPAYIGFRDDKFSFSHVEDVAAAHVVAIEKGRIGEKYLITGENGSLNLVFDLAAAITRTRQPKFHIPLWLLYLYGWLSVFYALLTGRTPLISYPAVKVMQHSWAYSCNKAREELGYSPRTLEEGMKEVLPWLKDLGLINY